MASIIKAGLKGVRTLKKKKTEEAAAITQTPSISPTATQTDVRSPAPKDFKPSVKFDKESVSVTNLNPTTNLPETQVLSRKDYQGLLAQQGGGSRASGAGASADAINEVKATIKGDTQDLTEVGEAPLTPQPADLGGSLLNPTAEVGAARRQQFLGTADKGVATKQVLAGLVDQFRIGIGGKKPLNVQQAENTLTDAQAILTADVAMVASGQKTLAEVQSNLDFAIESINRLEITQRGLGQQNLRYWSDNGREIEAELIRKRNDLRNLRLELINAQATAQQTRLQQAGFQ